MVTSVQVSDIVCILPVTLCYWLKLKNEIEMTSVSFCCFVDDMEGTSGHVGPPIPCSMIKLCDVPEMDLQVDRDGLGEVSISLTCVFFGTDFLAYSWQRFDHCFY